VSSSEQEYLLLDKNSFLKKWYKEEYAQVTYKGDQGFVQKLMHKSIERGIKKIQIDKTLELGANQGEHLPFVYDTMRYFSTDNNLDLIGKDSKIDTILDAANLPFSNNSFDRVLHMCLLHHVLEPEKVLEEMRRVTKIGGTISIFLSHDPGMLFRFGRMVGPLRDSGKRGLGNVKRLVDARDHINHVYGLKTLIKHVYRYDNINFKTFPFRYMPIDFSLWSIWQIKKLQR
jgi:phosphatidylethanolamine/phosphatidyl-N-methylethanolamine N-methyltransferase